MTYEMKNQEKTVWKRAFAFFRESISDNETDFTVGPIGRALGLLAIPMMLEMGMEAVFAVVDIAFVSRLGTNAMRVSRQSFPDFLFRKSLQISFSVTVQTHIAQVRCESGSTAPDTQNQKEISARCACQAVAERQS